MYQILSDLLADRKGGVVFTCFGFAHLCYMLAVFAIILVAVLYLKDKSRATKQKVLTLSVTCAFALYVLDFFLMPFAYGQIDIEKLPFHVCTAMCVMCFWSRHSRCLGKLRSQFAMLGFISNLVYLVYPAGVMWYQVHPLSYRVVQTLLFHGLMTIYGVLALVFDEVPCDGRSMGKSLGVIVGMTLWAMLGNFLYNAERNYNWFFVRQDPLSILPADIAPYIMPFVNIAVFFAVEMMLYSAFAKFKKKHKREA